MSNRFEFASTKPVVLVVDHSPEDLGLLSGILEATYTVRVARSGARALELAIQEPHPDLVLLDVLMPGMNGPAVLAALRKDHRTSHIPAIFITTLEGAGEKLIGVPGGAADYIVKPAAPEVVRARVRVQIELKQMRDRMNERNAVLKREVESRARVEEALRDTISDLEAFSYSVSHDLRSPLSAINAFALSLRETEAPSMSKDGQHRLDRIISGGRRMNKMIDDILLCSRAERAEMRLQTVNLDALVGEVVADLRHIWPTPRVCVGPLPAVDADSTMLRQIFANLVGNALKFSSGRPDPQVHIEARTAGTLTEIVVRDNGAGFDMAYSYKLFGLFQRLHNDHEFPGTGVGLAIVKRLVSRHGGSVRAESAPGGWTTFCFTLGVTRAANDISMAQLRPQISAPSYINS